MLLWSPGSPGTFNELTKELVLLKTDKVRWRKCTVFQSHPWDPKDRTKHGIVLWVPETIEELIKTAAQQLEFPSGSCILSEDAGKILDVDLISDGQKLALLDQSNTPDMIPSCEFSAPLTWPLYQICTRFVRYRKPFGSSTILLMLQSRSAFRQFYWWLQTKYFWLFFRLLRIGFGI